MSEQVPPPGESDNPIGRSLGPFLPIIPLSERARLQEVPRPNYAARVEALEEVGRSWQLPMRCGIEAEVMLFAPAGFRGYTESDTIHPYKAKIERGMIRNPELIDGEVIDDETKRGVLSDFREEARELVAGLVPQSEEEVARQAEWLGQIDDFGLRELINFRLYKEFSRPSLAITRPPQGVPLSKIDEYSEESGWLEFRFGTGKLQSGYYDSDSVSEIRLSPTSPGEAVRREATILSRMTEIASEYGVLLSMRKEHINLSMYEADSNGVMMPMIGQSEHRRKRTLDIVAGVGAAFEDGVWLHHDAMQYDYHFGQHGSARFEMGPTRKNLRIIEDRIELRSSFGRVDEGLTWLMSGAVFGAIRTRGGIALEGYSVPHEQQIFRVHNGPDFNKGSDLAIKRSFEKAVPKSTGGFDLSFGYLMSGGGELRRSLLGDEFSDIGLLPTIYQAVRLDSAGVPHVTVESLHTVYQSQVESSQERPLDRIPPEELGRLIGKVNDRLRRVRLESVTAILGENVFKREDRSRALAGLRSSVVAHMAYGDQLESVIDWLGSVEPVNPLE